MTMWMDLLICDFKTVFYKIQMVDIAKPDPRNVAFLCDSCFIIPLCFLPEIIRTFQIT